MSASASFTAATLLEPPTASQQRVLDTIAEGFIENDWKWPVSDYVEAQLEGDGIDPWIELERLPRHPVTSYAAAWWPRGGSVAPGPHEQVGLSVLGFHFVEARQQALKGIVPVFFALVHFVAEWRRQRPSSPAEPRDLSISSEEVILELPKRGVPARLLIPKLLLELLRCEPGMWNGGNSGPSGWTRSVLRGVYDFEDVETVNAYVEQMMTLFPPPLPRRDMAAPSPLGLVAAIDYLDTVWRLVSEHQGHLFQLSGAQRTAQLAFDAQTAEEFDSRLSGLGEVLRSARLPDGAPVVRRHRDRPLAGLEAYLKQLLPESHARVERAIQTLHDVLAVRDAGQHTAAGRKGAAALAKLGAGYPPTSWSYGWSVVAARTIEALDSLRDELATLAP